MKNEYVFKKIYYLASLYRYSSLILSSICYLMMTQNNQMGYKCVVLVSIILSAVIMDYLYRIKESRKNEIGILLVIETVINIIIIIASGGVKSPYIWFAINTVIIAAIEYDALVIQLNLAVYLISIALYQWLSFKQILDRGAEISAINVFIGFLLIGNLIHIVFYYIYCLKKTNKKLDDSNRKAEKALNLVMHTYRLISPTNSKSQEEVVLSILEYMNTTLGISKILFIEVSFEKEELRLHNIGMTKDEEDDLSWEFVKQYKETQSENIDSNTYHFIKQKYIGVPISYLTSYYGMLIVPEQSEIEELLFVRELLALNLKRFKVEKLEEELVISKEQNRIANEIHDSVLQQLFGISCSLFLMESEVDKKEKEEVKKNILYMRDLIQKAMKDLRNIVYDMSWNKWGTNQFVDKIKRYINEFEKMYRVQIDLKITGDTQNISIKEQLALYRILCEAISNGLKHGNATKLSIDLAVNMKGIELYIKDNGEGFDYRKVEQNEGFGVGIKNMTYLADTLGGALQLASAVGKGTELRVSIPTVS